MINHGNSAVMLFIFQYFQILDQIPLLAIEMKKIVTHILLLVTLISLATGVVSAVSPVTISDPGTYTGELAYGDYEFEWLETTYGDLDVYEIYLYQDENMDLTLDVPSGCDFDLVFECEYNSFNP